MTANEIRILGGSASRRLAEAISTQLGTRPMPSRVLRFPEGNLFVQIQQNVRGKDVYLVQSTAFPSNEHFMELLFWIDALKRASAASVTAVVPYFAYAKGDKKDQPRVSIRARVCADAIEAAGVDRVVTVDLHAPQIQGFFRVPVDDLYAERLLCDAARPLMTGPCVVVSPDVGFAGKARQFAARLDAPLAVADKQRLDHKGGLVIHGIIGDVNGRTALIVDDFTVMGGTLIKVAERLIERGAARVLAAVTHGLFADGCMERLDASPIEKLLITDTVETQPVSFSPKVQVVSAAGLLAAAIRRIHTRQSVSALFENSDKDGEKP